MEDIFKKFSNLEGKFFLLVVLTAAMSLSFLSCGDDEEDASPSEEVSNGGSDSNLNSETRFFVGNWAIAANPNTYYWTFYENGECDFVYLTTQEHGQWSYSTGMLSTTVGFWSFYIDATFNGAWTGTSKNGLNVKATKLADDDVATNHLQQPTPTPTPQKEWVTCPTCNGSTKCYSCKGSGKCYMCNGEGTYWGGHQCPVCRNGSCITCSGSGNCPRCKGAGGYYQ